MAHARFQPVYADDAADWERTYAMWCHLSALIAGWVVVFSDGIGFFVPALVVCVLWLLKRDESPFIDDHGKEALNFQISLAILFGVVVVVGALTCGVGLIVGLPLWAFLAVVGMIRGVVAAKRGRYFRYPACVRVIP